MSHVTSYEELSSSIFFGRFYFSFFTSYEKDPDLLPGVDRMRIWIRNTTRIVVKFALPVPYQASVRSFLKTVTVLSTTTISIIFVILFYRPSTDVLPTGICLNFTEKKI
jgi:hypothetical protein